MRYKLKGFKEIFNYFQFFIDKSNLYLYNVIC